MALVRPEVETEESDVGLRVPIGPAATPPRERGPGGRGYWWLIALGLALAGVGALVKDKQEPAAVDAPNVVRTVPVRKGFVAHTLRLSGTTVARDSALLRAPYLRGRRSSGSGGFELVLQDLVAGGSFVEKGQVVASFDQLAMRNRLDDYRAQREEQQSKLRLLQAELDILRAAHEQKIRAAKAKMERAELDLRTIPVRSALQAARFRLDHDEAKATYEALLKERKYVKAGEIADLRVVELQLREAEVEERRARLNAERLVVRAPVSGYVTLGQIYRGTAFSDIKEGDTLRPGHPYMQIVDTRSLIVRAEANQVDVQDLRAGAEARVRVEAYEDVELPAHVYSIGTLARTSRRRGEYVSEVPVFLELHRSDPRLVPNLTVSADITIRKMQGDGIVPLESIVRDPATGDSHAYVHTSDGWEKRKVEAGTSNNLEAVVESGVSEGESVGVTAPTV